MSPKSSHDSPRKLGRDAIRTAVLNSVDKELRSLGFTRLKAAHVFESKTVVVRCKVDFSRWTTSPPFDVRLAVEQVNKPESVAWGMKFSASTGGATTVFWPVGPDRTGGTDQAWWQVADVRGLRRMLSDVKRILRGDARARLRELCHETLSFRPPRRAKGLLNLTAAELKTTLSAQLGSARRLRVRLPGGAVAVQIVGEAVTGRARSRRRGPS